MLKFLGQTAFTFFEKANIFQRRSFLSLEDACQPVSGPSLEEETIETRNRVTWIVLECT